MKKIKIRVTKQVEEIHICPITDEEYEQINNGDIMLEDVVYGCGEENNRVVEIDSEYSYERAGILEKKEPINWQERLLEVSENADFIGHNSDILVRFYRDYNEPMKECGHSLKTLCKRLNGQFEDDRGNKGISLYIPREELTDDTYEKLMNIEL